MSAISRKRKSFTVEEKRKIIAEVQQGHSKKKVIAEKYGIACSTLSTILKMEEEIMADTDFPQQKKRRTADHPELDESVKKWFLQCRDRGVPVDGPMLKEKASIFAEKLGHVEFKGSNGWLMNFKRRNGLICRKICGESGTVTNDVCLDWREELKPILEEFEGRDIFNADETGLFFKCLPDKTFTTQHDDCNDGKRSKERVTVLLGANMDGSEKLELFMIGKSAKPRCFKGVKSLPVEYSANRKAWMTSVLFEHWLKQLDKKMTSQKRKICLVLDNCTAHPTHVRSKSVKLKFLPPRTTSKLQPMDRGIIKNVKHKYRREVVRRYIADIDENKVTNITVLDAMHMLHKAWKNVEVSTISNCFKACGFSKDQENNDDEDEVILPSSLPLDESFVEDDDLAERLLSETNVNFSEFVSFDDDLPVTGLLTDEDILSSVNEREEDSDDELENAEEIRTVSMSEARAALEKVRLFLGQCDLQDEKDTTYNSLVNIDNIIDKNSSHFMIQKKITEFYAPS